MKIAILSTNYDLGGAATVTARLCRALRELGEDARMIVARPGGAEPEDPAVIRVGRLHWGVPFLAERAELFGRYGVRRPDLFKVSTGRFGVGLDRAKFVRQADAVIVSWASQGFLSLGALERIVATGRPVVYVMHDLWAATGLCHLPGECRKFQQEDSCRGCPYLRGADRLVAGIAERKRRIFSAENVSIVAVSSWQSELAASSAILRGKEIHVIPHPFPVDEYLPGSKDLPGDKRLIVMAAARLDDPVKDLPMAVEALNLARRKNPAQMSRVEVAFAGEIRDPGILAPLEVPYTTAGLLPSDALPELYAPATLVLSSSRYETMGATLMEGMSAGATPVTFGEAGQCDIVTDGVNGYIASAHNAHALAAAILQGLEHPFDPQAQHQSVADRFSPPTIAKKYLTLLIHP